MNAGKVRDYVGLLGGLFFVALFGWAVSKFSPSAGKALLFALILLVLLYNIGPVNELLTKMKVAAAGR